MYVPVILAIEVLLLDGSHKNNVKSSEPETRSSLLLVCVYEWSGVTCSWNGTHAQYNMLFHIRTLPVAIGKDGTIKLNVIQLV